MPANPIFTQLSTFLTNAGLGELFTVDQAGTPGGWLWEQITGGIDNVEQLSVAIESTQAYQRRFGAIIRLRQRAAAGEPVHIPTIKEVRAYEDTVRQMMKSAGLPPSFYDSYEDIQPLLEANLAPTQIEQRLGAAWERTRNVSPAIRAKFAQFYGPQGDSQLAAWFLDPNRVESELEKASRAAYTAGMGQSLGVDLDQQMAERIAMLPKTEAGINQDLGEISKLQGLASEGISETDNITTGDTVEAVAFGDGRAAGKLERRSLERQVVGRASTGGAIADRAGIAGLGNS